MSRTLYDDALAEATQLREMAEQNAKKAIIEAMTPKIRNLIESELSGDSSLNPNDDFLSELEVPSDLGSEEGVEEPSGDLLDLDLLSQQLASMSGTDPGATADVAVSPRQIGGDAPGATDAPSPTDSLDAPTELVGDEPAAEDQPEGDILSDVDEVEVTGETLRLLAALLQEKDFTRSVNTARKRRMTAGELHERISNLSSQVLTISKVDSVLDEASDHEKIRVNEIWNKLVTELKTLRSELICIEGKDSSRVRLLKQGLLQVFEEMKEMSNRRNKDILYELNVDELFEGGYMASGMYEEDDADMAPDEAVADDGGDDADDDLADVDLDEEGEGTADPEVVDAVDNLILALGIDPEDLGAEEDLEDLGDEDLGDVEGLEGGEGPEDAAEEVEESQRSDDDEIIEIDEGMLRRELFRMRRLAEGDTGWDTIGDPASAAGSFGGAKNVSREKPSDTNSVGDAVKGASSFGGGKSGKEPFVDMSDKDLNVYAENRQLRKNLRDRSRKNRALNNQLAEFKKAVLALRSQLSEMNLFNAKLLYANKLLQNKDITNTQLRSMVEALDNAKSLREVKLLYKTLTESIRGKKTSLSESSVRRAVGSSSRPTRSAASDNRSPEVDRWALLAGINES